MAKQIEKYGLYWSTTLDAAWVEMQMVQKGGRWKKKTGGLAGMGTEFHFKQVIKHIWPEIVWHRWIHLFVEEYLKNRTIVAIGPASSGKTHDSAVCLLADYYCFPNETTGIVCSTTKERLEDRVWGEIKRLHKAAIRVRSWLPGHLIEGRQRLVTDDRAEVGEGRDFRNGLVGVPCRQGNQFTGLGDFIGIKNKRVRLLGDELHLLPRVFVDSISNLDKNPDLKVIGMGNPKDTTDALGVLAEPAADMGGWDSGIDQTPKTKTWRIRRPQGVCIQFVGTDSPNLDGKLGIPLITQEQIDRDVSFYGRDSVWFSMMDQGMMPRGSGSRRVLTRQFCLQHKAMEPPVWLSEKRTRIACLDAAYRAVGGDRCVLMLMEFGPQSSISSLPGNEVIEAIISQRSDTPERDIIIALQSTMIVPIKAGDALTPEDQIVNFTRDICKAKNVPPENFFFDSGMRSSLVSAFARLWSNKTNAIDCGGTASQRKVSANIDVVCKDYYSKFITELWWSVRLSIEAEQFRGMTEEVMMEGCQREWKTVGNNKTEVESKEEMKLKTGRSPDLFDCLAIGIEGARRLGFVIKKLGTVEEKFKDDRWKSDLMKKARTLHGSKLNYAV
jgi:hypothetical protein